jgi:stage II sporulation protein D
MKQLAAIVLLALVTPVCAASQPEELRINILSLLSPREAIVSAAGTLVVELPEREPKRFMLHDQTDIYLRTGPESTLQVQIQGEEYPAVMAEFIPARESDVQVHLLAPHRFDRSYTGRLSIAAQDNTLQFILHKNLEEYVIAAAISEFGLEEEHLQAFLAGIVCIRSYALSLRRGSESAAFDFYDHTGHLYFTGGDANKSEALFEKYRDEIAATDGLVLSGESGIIPGYFSAACGGATSDIGRVWGVTDFNEIIKGVDCPACRENSESSWSRSLPVETIADALAESGNGNANLSLIQNKGKIIMFNPAGQEIGRYSAESFRIALGRALGWDTIPGNRFVLVQNNSTVHISGRGRGHGVGLCQAGAMAMSRSGKNWRDILKWYFPEVAIRNAAD